MHARTLEAALPALELEALYRAHAPKVAVWVRRLGAPEPEVEDLVHEVFLVAERRLAEFRGEARVTTWLFRITERVVLSHRRRRAAHPAAAPLELPDPSPGPEDQLHGQELSRAVHETLSALPDHLREVLEQSLLAERRPREVALELGLSSAAVWGRSHRARREFRARFLARHPSLVPMLALMLALLCVSLGATAIARWVGSRAPSAAPPAAKPTASPKTTRAAAPPPETPAAPAPPASTPAASRARRASAPVVARPSPTPSPPLEAGAVSFAPRTVIEFDGAELGPAFERAAAPIWVLSRRPRFEGRLLLREHFLPEIMSSVDRL